MSNSRGRISRNWFRSFLRPVTAALLAAGLLAACSSGAKPTAPAPAQGQAPASPAPSSAPAEKVTIRVGRIPQAQAMVPVTEVMRKDKLVEAAGKEVGVDITVDWQDFPNGAVIRQALTGDKLDFGSVGNTPTLIGLAQGEPVRVLSMAEGGVKFVIVLPPNSPIKTVEELKGKKIGLLLGTDMQFFFNMTMAANVGTGDYQKLGIQPMQLKTLAQAGVPPEGIDATAITETPYLVGKVQNLNKALVNSYGYTEEGYDGPLGKGAGIALPSLKTSPYYPEGFYLHRNFWLVTDNMSKKSPKAIVAFLMAQQRALQVLAKTKAEDVAAMSKEAWQLEPAVGKSVWLNDLNYRRGWGWLTEGDLRAIVDQSVLAAENKLIQKPVSWAQMLENIKPLEPLAKEAWERTKFPESAAFTAKDVKDIRGYPMWESGKWELPKKK